MNIKELENKLTEEHLLKIYDRGNYIYYWANFSSLEEACDDLYDEISLLDAIYKEKVLCYIVFN